MPHPDPVAGAARENFCRLLAASYYQPEASLAKEGLFAGLKEAAASLDPYLADEARRLEAAFAKEGIDELLVEYTRLFLGPVEAVARPYGSVWLTKEKTLMQESSMDVLELYREGGFDLAEDFRELPDHVSAELEFLYLLNFRENRARRDDDAALAGILALKRRFLEQHLGTWVPAFCRAVSEGSTGDFYRALASLTERFVRLETERARAG
jgi:TorA maturation chaperone TorD